MKNTIEQHPSVSLYCDNQNVFLNQEEANLLLDFTKSKGRLRCQNVYYNSECNNHSDINKQRLENIGYECKNVPCPLKNSADNQLIADCLDDNDHNCLGSTVIIVSGDGDFAKLVKALKGWGKKVIILARRGNVKQRLTELADEFHFIDELPQLVGNKTEPSTDGALSSITYEDAIACLREAIKTALSQNKDTTFSSIGKLMRNNKRFPGYQGVSSIRKADGNNFSRFSKFINAAVAEGKVKIINQELFLIEEDKLAA
ncbi:MAG TPA: NYN domain-containing protein [Candidatus Obscuribacterales bacterium]